MGSSTGTPVMVPIVDTERPIYVSLQEKREIVPGVKQNRSRGSGGNHTYVVKFFLVDSKGGLHYAATGVDGGDSHYEYTNEPGFPYLSCHNKSEVKAWGEKIIWESQVNSGYHTDLVKDEVPTNSTTINLPQFVSYSETKSELPDGRHQICWFLLDTSGHNHLAVVGDEKETRDGHYVYHTENVFDKAAPLIAHNQEEVKRWLNWIIGPRTEPLTPSFYSSFRSKAKPRSARSRAKSFSTPKTRGSYRGRGRPPRQSIYGSVTFGGSGHGASRRGRGNFRVYDLDFDARSVTALEIRKWLEEEVKYRENKKCQALAFADDKIPVYENDIFEKSCNTLKPLHAAIMSSTALGKEELMDAIGALRELHHLRPTLRMASDENVVNMLNDIMENGPEILSESCKWILQDWLKCTAANVGILLDERYIQDPRPAAEKIIDNPAEFDRLVSSITYRKLSANPPFAGLANSMPETPAAPVLHMESAMTSGKSVQSLSRAASEAPVATYGAVSAAQSESLLEDNVKMVGDEDVAILPPFQQEMSMQGIEY